MRLRLLVVLRIDFVGLVGLDVVVDFGFVCYWLFVILIWIDFGFEYLAWFN